MTTSGSAERANYTGSNESDFTYRAAGQVGEFTHLRFDALTKIRREAAESANPDADRSRPAFDYSGFVSGVIDEALTAYFDGLPDRPEIDEIASSRMRNLEHL
jgi:hypothetical protein